MSFEIVLQTVLNSLQYASVLSLSAFAIILIFKTSVTTNFAQGTISIVGAHMTAYMFTKWGVSLWWAIPAGMIVAFVLGILVDTQLLRRSRLVTPVGKQMITMGLVLFLTGIIPTVFGLDQLFIDPLAFGNWNFTLFSHTYTITYHSLLTTGIATILLSVLFVALKYTKWGLGVRATASNELVASMMGVNTRTITAISWSIAGGLGALAAILYGATLTFGSGYMTNVQVNGFLAAILGGFGTFHGPVVGSILITFLGNIIGYEYSVWKDVIVYIIILLITLYKPLGLFGKKVIKKV